MKTTLFSLGATAVALLPTGSAPSSRVALGPPLVCFPFDIGTARSLPWSAEGGAFDGDPKYSGESLVRDTIAILEESRDVLVHMETLRQACIYASRFDGRPVKGAAGGSKGRPSLTADRLIVKILDRSLRTLAKEPRSELAWLDAGYVLGASEKLGTSHGCEELTYLRNARDAAPADAAVQFALAAAILDSPEREGWQAEFRSALTRAPEGSLVRKNLLAFGRHFLGEEKLDALLAPPSK